MIIDRELTAYRAIRLLASGFGNQFAEVCQNNEQIQEIMMDLALDFVDNEITIVNEDDRVDMAAEIIRCMSINFSA